MDVAQISQGLSYKAYSTTSLHYFSFGLFILVFGTQPSYTRSLLLCYEDVWDSLIALVWQITKSSAIVQITAGWLAKKWNQLFRGTGPGSTWFNKKHFLQKADHQESICFANEGFARFLSNTLLHQHRKNKSYTYLDTLFIPSHRIYRHAHTHAQVHWVSLTQKENDIICKNIALNCFQITERRTRSVRIQRGSVTSTLYIFAVMLIFAVVSETH